jgi:hypothetical protein
LNGNRPRQCRRIFSCRQRQQIHRPSPISSSVRNARRAGYSCESMRNGSVGSSAGIRESKSCWRALGFDEWDCGFGWGRGRRGWPGRGRLGRGRGRGHGRWSLWIVSSLSTKAGERDLERSMVSWWRIVVKVGDVMLTMYWYYDTL